MTNIKEKLEERKKKIEDIKCFAEQLLKDADKIDDLILSYRFFDNGKTVKCRQMYSGIRDNCYGLAKLLVEQMVKDEQKSKT